MLIIAENINVMSKKIGAAMKERDAKPVQELAVQLTQNGADILDINLGPARKEGDDLMKWMVKTVQEVTDLPLALDTMNIVAMEAGLQVYKQKKGKAIINSISARPDRMEPMMPFCAKYDAAFVALTISEAGIPRDANERGELAATLMANAMEAGIDIPDMFFDPIVVPVSSQQVQVPECTLFMEMVPDMAPGSNSTCGLSNISNGSPNDLRPILNQTYLCMLKNVGLTSAILDGLDKDIIDLAKGNGDWPKIQELVGKVQRREDVDFSKLNEREIKFAKTAKVLIGDALYSDSWLDL